MNPRYVGYVGIVAFGLAWIPQSLETIKDGYCKANLAFLLLAMLGSLSLTIYALLEGDAIFAIINTLTTLGALVNAYFKLFPRCPEPSC